MADFKIDDVNLENMLAGVPEPEMAKKENPAPDNEGDEGDPTISDFKLHRMKGLGDQDKAAGGRLCTKCFNNEKAHCLERQARHIYRKAFSETKLLEIMPHDLQDGTTYHCISGGDIDSLSYIKHIIRIQRLDYLLFSSWCMATDDIRQLYEWILAEKIKRLDAYVGEIFCGSYAGEWEELKKVIRFCNGRVCIARNHAKIYAGIGSKFAFAIESSANMNTNPRIENTAVIVGRDAFDFYKNFFDGLISFNRDFDDWKKWEPETKNVKK